MIKCANQTYRTIRGDNFILHLANLDADITSYTQATMTLRRVEDGEVVLKASSPLEETLTTLEFKPEETKDLEGLYVIDLELRDNFRKKVQTLFVSDLYVEKDVTYERI